MNLAKWLQACSGITHSTVRWFHVWFLPAVWLVSMVVLWTIVRILHVTGDARMIADLGGLAGLWLAFMFDPATSGVPGELTACIGGVMVMGVAGLFQDLLRVSKRIVCVYCTVWLSAFAIACAILGQGAKWNLYFQFFLATLCWSLYVFSVLSIAVYSVVRAWQSLVRVLRYPE